MGSYAGVYCFSVGGICPGHGPSAAARGRRRHNRPDRYDCTAARAKPPAAVRKTLHRALVRARLPHGERAQGGVPTRKQLLRFCLPHQKFSSFPPGKRCRGGTGNWRAAADRAESCSYVADRQWRYREGQSDGGPRATNLIDALDRPRHHATIWIRFRARTRPELPLPVTYVPAFRFHVWRVHDRKTQSATRSFCARPAGGRRLSRTGAVDLQPGRPGPRVGGCHWTGSIILTCWCIRRTETVQNACGKWGSLLASMLLTGLGIGAYYLVISLGTLDALLADASWH